MQKFRARRDHPRYARRMNDTPGAIPVLLLAGSRPSRDPIAERARVPVKALAPVAGRPMIDHVARALLAHPRIGTVTLLAQKPQVLLDHPQTAWMADEPRIALHTGGEGISQSILDFLADRPGYPLLVTSADNVLLDSAMLDSLLAGAAGHDVAVGMVERRVLLARYPQSRRTWLKFRGGWWSGANLFWLGSERARGALEKWRAIEQDRKKGWKILSAFGPLLLLGAALRLLSLPRALKLAGRRMGLDAALVPLPQPEACIDADKPDDITLIEAIIAGRAGA